LFNLSSAFRRFDQGSGSRSKGFVHPQNHPRLDTADPLQLAYRVLAKV
jgi:hypothetical protein